MEHAKREYYSSNQEKENCMIVFDNDKFLMEIKNKGIGSTDLYAMFKLNFLMEDLVFNSTYRKNKIIEKVKSIAQEYFYGLPDNIVNQELGVLYESAKAKANDDARKKHEKKQ